MEECMLWWRAREREGSLRKMRFLLKGWHSIYFLTRGLLFSEITTQGYSHILFLVTCDCAKYRKLPRCCTCVARGSCVLQMGGEGGQQWQVLRWCQRVTSEKGPLLKNRQNPALRCLFSDQVCVSGCVRREVGRCKMRGVAELKKRLPLGKKQAREKVSWENSPT